MFQSSEMLGTFVTRRLEATCCYSLLERLSRHEFHRTADWRRGCNQNFCFVASLANTFASITCVQEARLLLVDMDSPCGLFQTSHHAELQRSRRQLFSPLLFLTSQPVIQLVQRTFTLRFNGLEYGAPGPSPEVITPGSSFGRRAFDKRAAQLMTASTSWNPLSPSNSISSLSVIL